MLQQRRMAAEQVAASLFETEAAIDGALAAAARLAGLMPVARSDAKVSALIGQGAIERAIEAMAELGRARRAIVEAHKELTIAQHDVGLRAVNFGGSEPKPVIAALESAGLQVIAA